MKNRELTCIIHGSSKQFIPWTKSMLNRHIDSSKKMNIECNNMTMIPYLNCCNSSKPSSQRKHLYNWAFWLIPIRNSPFNAFKLKTKPSICRFTSMFSLLSIILSKWIRDEYNQYSDFRHGLRCLCVSWTLGL